MEQIYEVTLKQGGITTEIPGITRDQKRKLARKVRPTSEYSGTLTIKKTDTGLYRFNPHAGLLQFPEWILIS